MATEAARMMDQPSFDKETNMTDGASAMANQPRRIIEPIFDASGTLRRIPAERTKPAFSEDRAASHPARS